MKHTVVVNLFPSWLVWGRNQVYCAFCSAKTLFIQALKLIHQSRQQVLRAYCPNTVDQAKNVRNDLWRVREIGFFFHASSYLEFKFPFVTLHCRSLIKVWEELCLNRIVGGLLEQLRGSWEIYLQCSSTTFDVYVTRRGFPLFPTGNGQQLKLQATYCRCHLVLEFLVDQSFSQQNRLPYFRVQFPRKLFFFESRKCVNFHIVSAIFYFIN